MRLFWAAATVVCGQPNGIFSPQIEEQACKMTPYPFNPAVFEYGVECEGGTRAFHLQVKADTNVEVIGPTGRTRAAGEAGTVVEAKVLLFQSMLTSVSVDAFGGVYSVNMKVKREDKEVASRAFVWKDDQEKTHMVMARSLPEINENGLADKSVAHWTGQPYKNFESCSYESGLKMSSEEHSTSYWIHAACKTGSVDAASIILSGRGLEKKDIKCKHTPTCPKYESNSTITKLETTLRDSKMNPYLLRIAAGDGNNWDMLGCPVMQTVCKIGKETIYIEASAGTSAEIDAKIDASPIVPHCVKPGIKRINIAMQYDLGGLELPDQICNQRGSADNNIFMCPEDVDHVKVEVYVNDASAMALAWGSQIPKVASNRDGEVFYSFEAPVGTMGCNDPTGCPRGPFEINVLCGDAFDEVKMAIANNKGVHGKPPLPSSPIGDLKSTDCKMKPEEFHPKIYTYTVECKSQAEIPLNVVSPPHLKSLVVEYRYKSQTLGEMTFQNNDDKLPDSVHLMPAEKLDLEVKVIRPEGKRYTFHMTRLGTTNLNFEPFQFKMLQTKTADGDICTVHPDWDPKKHHHYNISCSQGIKEINMTIPPPEEISGEVVEVIFSSKVLDDVDYISSSPSKVAKYQIIPMKLGEAIDFQINTEEPVEGPTYHFNVHRSGGALGADFTKKLARFFSTLAVPLAIMSGGNFITVIKFIQFMGIFAGMGGVPEAYGDFVDQFKTFNFQFDIMAIFPKEKIEGLLFTYLGPSLGMPSGGGAVSDLKAIKKKYAKQYKEIKRKINDIKEKISKDAGTLQQLFMVPFMVICIGAYHGFWMLRYRCKPSERPQHNVRELEFAPLTLFIMDFGLIGFCLTTSDYLFKGKKLDVGWGVFRLNPDELHLQILMICLVAAYPIFFLMMSYGVSSWMKKNLAWNEAVGTYTDKECVEIHATAPTDMLGPIERLPLIGGVIKKAIPESFRFEREIKAIAPVTAPGDAVEGLHIRDEEAAAGEALSIATMCKEYLPTIKRDEETKKPIYPYIQFGSGKSDDEEKAERARKKFEDKQKKMRESEGDAFMEVALNSTAFRGEGAVQVSPEDTDVSEVLIRKDARKKLYEDKAKKEAEKKLKRGNTNLVSQSTSEALEPEEGEELLEDEAVDTHPLLAGVSPNAYVYRLSSVYDRFPEAKVGRIRMNVPTVRGRTGKVAPESGGSDSKDGYKHINNFDAQVTCRDIPGLNWYVPNTKLQVPQKNMAFKYSAMYSQLLKGSTKRSIFGFVFTRSIQVISIYGVAAAGAAQEAGKAAMEGAMDKVKSAAKKEVDGAVKEAESEIKAEAKDKAAEGAEAAAEAAAPPAAPPAAKERMLGEVNDVLHIATGAGLFSTGTLIGAGAIGARLLRAVEGAAEPRFLEAEPRFLAEEAAHHHAVHHAKKAAGFLKGIWNFFFPTPGLSQGAVLMFAQLINFFVSTKGALDEAEGDLSVCPLGKFWTTWLSGECLIYFGEIMLLVVFMLATPEFPYSVKALWKEDISAITMIALSALTILVLNSLWGISMIKLAISKVAEIRTTMAAWKEKAIQNWEYAKSVYTVCKDRAIIMCGDDAKKKREVREEIYAGFKQQLFETCPWLETAQRLREQYAPKCMQDPEDGGYFGDKEIGAILIVVFGLGYLIFKILHHHAVKAVHHGLHHLAKHGDVMNGVSDAVKGATDAVKNEDS
jgi:hypothetical protein